MRRTAALACGLLLFVASPAGAASFQIWEDSLGSPGATAEFSNGTGLIADIDFDADSAEGGALLFGASEIRIVPLGDLVFVNFTCQLGPPCDEDFDYVFTPGGAGIGEIIVSDPNFDSPMNGIFDLGLIEFDIASGVGQVRLTGCNYTDANAVERQCDPFTLVNVPEPGTGALLGAGIAALALARRRRGGSRDRAGLRGISSALVLATLLGTGAGGAAVPDPSVAGPITGGLKGYPLWDSWFDLAPFGYEEAEYFVSGTARAHPAGPADAAYTTRIIVFRPSDPADFNGTVVLDWTNVTAQFENAVNSITSYQHLLRDGYAYVHVSAQAAGICCAPQLTPQPWDPLRYGLPGSTNVLNHPGDAYSFDMFAQIAQALKSPTLGADASGPLTVERVIAVGQSQSGSRLATYVQEVQGGIGEDVIDGFVVHGSAGGSKGTLSVNAQAPMVHLLSDAEYSTSGPDPNASPHYVLWEIAGTSHSDFWIGNHQVLGQGPRSQAGAAKQDPAGVAALQLHAGNYGEQIDAGSQVCIVEGAMFPMRYAANAAIHHLDQWLRGAPAPPSGPRFQDDGGSLARDGFGNALGGIRLAPIDVPIASYNSTACPLGGTTTPFTEIQILGLYPTHADYVCQMRERTYENVQDGWLLVPDAEDLLTRVDAAQNRWLLDTSEADCDGDGVPDALDNCPLVSNPGQLDSGGINTTVADGIGDPCQCGDVTGNGIVNGQDGNAIRRHAGGADPNPAYRVPGNCDVTGDGVCSGQDGKIVRLVSLGIDNPLFGQNCQNADPYAPECENCLAPLPGI